MLHFWLVGSFHSGFISKAIVNTLSLNMKLWMIKVALKTFLQFATHCFWDRLVSPQNRVDFSIFKKNFATTNDVLFSMVSNVRISYSIQPLICLCLFTPPQAATGNEVSPSLGSCYKGHLFPGCRWQQGRKHYEQKYITITLNHL